MRFWAGIGVAFFLTASIAHADQIITATFENFTAGQSFQPSFTDSLSGITFRNSTHSSVSEFDIDTDPSFFGGGNYLTSGGGPVGALGGSFGFTADLPSPADGVVFDAIYLADSRSNVLLQGFNSNGVLVAQQAGPSGISSASFPLRITDSQFDITTFSVSVGGGAAGYDNISFTTVPEATSTLTLCLSAPFFVRKR